MDAAIRRIDLRAAFGYARLSQPGYRQRCMSLQMHVVAIDAKSEAGVNCRRLLLGGISWPGPETRASVTPLAGLP